MLAYRVRRDASSFAFIMGESSMMSNCLGLPEVTLHIYVAIPLLQKLIIRKSTTCSTDFLPIVCPCRLNVVSLHYDSITKHGRTAIGIYLFFGLRGCDSIEPGSLLLSVVQSG